MSSTLTIVGTSLLFSYYFYFYFYYYFYCYWRLASLFFSSLSLSMDSFRRC